MWIYVEGIFRIDAVCVTYMKHYVQKIPQLFTRDLRKECVFDEGVRERVVEKIITVLFLLFSETGPDRDK